MSRNVVGREAEEGRGKKDKGGNILEIREEG
jgi:hypothetical protein